MAAEEITGLTWKRQNAGLFSDLAREDQEKAKDWIRAEIKPRKTPTYNATSYWLKHVLEHDTGIYMTNDQFKDAMLECGFIPVDKDELNWDFCISKRSPCFVYRNGIV